jgi:monofunctional biosynthetic peptidoglycan transglycosylase
MAAAVARRSRAVFSRPSAPSGIKRVGRWIAAGAAFVYVTLTALYFTLPDVRPLATSNPQTTAWIELRGRQARGEGSTARRAQRWVPYTRISPALKRAVLIAEDSGFFEHDGVDYDQLRESIEVNLERFELSRGASTLTQQLAKNLYLSPSKNPLRKLRELMIARLLEAGLPKRRIFEIYLNVIEWGDGVYGAEAAARAYFGVSAASLSAEQSALLAGAIVNPRLLNPGAPTRRLLARQRLILRRMGGGFAAPAPTPTPAPEPAITDPAALPATPAPTSPPTPQNPPSSGPDQTSSPSQPPPRP